MNERTHEPDDLSEAEREAGTVTLVLLPGQVGVLNELLAPRGFMVSPPADLGDGPIRCLTFIDPPVR